VNIFQESSGDYSIRRVLAGVFSVLACVAGSASIFFRLGWKIVAVSFGVPIVAVLVLLFFTTWGDVIETIKTVKGKNE